MTKDDAIKAIEGESASYHCARSERDAIVKWLRHEGNLFAASAKEGTSIVSQALFAAANQIMRCEHLPPEKA